jgi:Metallopeptidase family M24
MAVGKTEIEISLTATTDAILIMLDALGATYASPGRGIRNPPVSVSFIAGANTALPHGMRREQGLQPGDAIITGASANVGGYRSELERTMIVGEPSPVFVTYFDAMLAIQQAGFRALRPGRTCADVEADVRGSTNSSSICVGFGTPCGAEGAPPPRPPNRWRAHSVSVGHFGTPLRGGGGAGPSTPESLARGFVPRVGAGPLNGGAEGRRMRRGYNRHVVNAAARRGAPPLYPGPIRRPRNG